MAHKENRVLGIVEIIDSFAENFFGTNHKQSTNGHSKPVVMPLPKKVLIPPALIQTITPNGNTNPVSIPKPTQHPISPALTPIVIPPASKNSIIEIELVSLTPEKENSIAADELETPAVPVQTSPDLTIVLEPGKKNSDTVIELDSPALSDQDSSDVPVSETRAETPVLDPAPLLSSSEIRIKATRVIADLKKTLSQKTDAINDLLAMTTKKARHAIYEAVLNQSQDHPEKTMDPQWAEHHVADDAALLLNVLIEELPVDRSPALTISSSALEIQEDPCRPIGSPTRDTNDIVKSTFSFKEIMMHATRVIADRETTSFEKNFMINDLLQETTEEARKAIYKEIFEHTKNRPMGKHGIADDPALLLNVLIEKLPQ